MLHPLGTTKVGIVSLGLKEPGMFPLAFLFLANFCEKSLSRLDPCSWEENERLVEQNNVSLAAPVS